MNTNPGIIVLCRPEESRNIGSVCRAMKNMACTELRIVGTKEDYSDEHIKTLSVHAYNIWENAQFFPPSIEGLQEALADCRISAGTTRRLGAKRKTWGMTPEQFADHVYSQDAEGNIAVVFGNERTGLTDDELACCNTSINIPSSPDFPSLNLSHAVQLITYLLYRSFDPRKRGYESISIDRIHSAGESITDNLKTLGLYKKMGAEDNQRFLEGIIARAALSEGEIQRLETLFHRITYVKIAKTQE
jgi:tRNA/rRNA methyltransferase